MLVLFPLISNTLRIRLVPSRIFAAYALTFVFPMSRSHSRVWICSAESRSDASWIGIIISAASLGRSSTPSERTHGQTSSTSHSFTTTAGRICGCTSPSSPTRTARVSTWTGGSRSGRDNCTFSASSLCRQSLRSDDRATFRDWEIPPGPWPEYAGYSY